ncbi:MAG: penicillin acylase family protein [Candidatus Thorarchaeota archaeon]
MRENEKKVVANLSTAITLTIIVMVIFSIPILGIPSLGGILFPGNGLWKIPGEVPTSELLKIPGLNNEVTVIRDEWGIPHIYASTDLDLFFAQGYCHAQDRFFQMDMMRRQVRGMLSEILGEDFLTIDQFSLAMGMEKWAIKTEEKLREMNANGTINLLPNMERYVDGINYYLETHRNQKPLEYYLLNFEPTEWTFLDSLCLVQEMARQMTWGYEDFYRLINYEALGPSNYSELFNPFQPYQVPICPNYGDYGPIPKFSGVQYESNPSLKNAVLKFLADVENIDSEKKILESQEIIGSNNWVVNGTKSNTGKPILCNDMHLSWIMPGIWYEQHLVSTETDLNVYGFTIPGMPLCAVGHNEYVGWGFTNTGYDVLDWYYYDVVNDTHYIYDHVSTAYTYRTHEIKVKGGGTETLTVKETVHGPVLSDLRDFGLPTAYGDVVIAPQWTAHDYYYNFLAGNGFDRATNRNEFDEASKYWSTLAQNIVYGDIDGNIAIRSTGNVPIRDDSKIPLGHLGNGTIPYNGSNGEGEWIGYIPFEDLPNTINPSQKYLASANQIVAGPNWNYSKYFLQNEYNDGYRARRINEVLSKAPDGTVSIDTMKSLQHDVNSSAAEAFIPYLIDVINFEYGSSPPPQIASVLTQLEGWKYVMDKDYTAPTIYRKWRDYFLDYTFNDEFNYLGAVGSPSIAVLEYLMKEDELSHWFDDINTGPVESRNETMLKALDDTIIWLEDFYDSSDPSTWKWGAIHQVYFEHLTFLEPLSVGPYPYDGEGRTVMPSNVNIRSGVGIARGGASERLIIDFNNINNTISVIPSGERGYPNSKHYSDQLTELYLQNKYHTQYFGYSNLDFPQYSIESTIYFLPYGGS